MKKGGESSGLQRDFSINSIFQGSKMTAAESGFETNASRMGHPLILSPRFRKGLVRRMVGQSRGVSELKNESLLKDSSLVSTELNTANNSQVK